MKQKGSLQSGCIMVFPKINSYDLNSFNFRVSKRWNDISKSVIGCTPLLHLHLGGQESIKMRTDASNTTEAHVNGNT